MAVSDALANLDKREVLVIGGVLVSVVVIAAVNALLSDTASAGPRRGSDFKKPVVKGRLLCPVEEGKQPVTHVNVGDFIVIKLLSDDGGYSESAWAHVLGKQAAEGGIVLRVELTSSLSASGFKSLQTDKHGFSLGERLTMLPECIYDVHVGPSPTQDYAMLCGLFLTKAGYAVSSKVVGLAVGDKVQVVLASPPLTPKSSPGEGWTEEIWIQVQSIGESGVVHGSVRSQPKNTTALKRNNEIDFAKDCIIHVQAF